MRTYAPEKAPKAGIIDDTILLDVHNEELPQKKGQMRTRCSKGASRRREDGGLRPLCLRKNTLVSFLTSGTVTQIRRRVHEFVTGEKMFF